MTLEELHEQLEKLEQKVSNLNQIVEEVPHPLGLRLTNSLVSTNFSSGKSGWRIQDNGDVEFNTGDFRGTLTIGNTSGDSNTGYIEILGTSGRMTHFFEGDIRTVIEDGVISFTNIGGTGGGSIKAGLSAANNIIIDAVDETFQFDSVGLAPGSNSASLGTTLSKWGDIRVIKINNSLIDIYQPKMAGYLPKQQHFDQMSIFLWQYPICQAYP